MIKLSPIKTNKLSENIITTHVSNNNGVKHYESSIFSTKTGDRKGFVSYHIDKVFREKQWKPSVNVTFIFSNTRGSGTALLNFVKNFSKQNGCEGRFHLLSDISLMPSKIPHIFYRKFGLNTGDKIIDKKLDRFIKKGKNATYHDFKSVKMYFPPIENGKTPSLIEKIKSFLRIK